MLQYLTDFLSGFDPYSHYGRLGVGIAVLGLLAYMIFSEEPVYPKVPIMGLDEAAWFKFEKSRRKYVSQGKAMVEQGVKKFAAPFQIVTGTGPMIFIPARFAEEIKDIKSLSFSKFVKREFFTDLPGFDAAQVLAHPDGIIQTIVRTKLTQTLNLVTDDLSDEAALSLQDTLGDNEEWTEVTLKPLILHFVARLSARLFVGTELCRHEEWLELSKGFTVHIWAAARAMRAVPWPFRRIALYLLPYTRRCRADINRAREILAPIIEARLQRNREYEARGEKPPKQEDTIGWIHEECKKRGTSDMDIAVAQLALSTTAIHTTTELVCGCLLDMLLKPEFLDELRQEMVSVLGGTVDSTADTANGRKTEHAGESGWKKTSMYQLRLLDSALKESQRLHTRDIGTMRRFAEKPVKLSNGTVIPKGAYSMVLFDEHHNPEVFPRSETYEPRRFYEMRNRPGEDTKWQLVSTSPYLLQFGLGMHACPGRFFAATEIKVAMVHMLLKYDWKYPDGKVVRPQDWALGTEMGVSPSAKVMYRRRKEEIQV